MFTLTGKVCGIPTTKQVVKELEAIFIIIVHTYVVSAEVHKWGKFC